MFECVNNFFLDFWIVFNYLFKNIVVIEYLKIVIVIFYKVICMVGFFLIMFIDCLNVK